MKKKKQPEKAKTKKTAGNSRKTIRQAAAAVALWLGKGEAWL
ncbi:MAG: hypothetical protein ABSA34_05350 [Candidatus Goldiibacteriota bacterium]|jgi:hypothetical protein